MPVNTIKVQPWGKDQGDYVLINESDFNPNFHKKLGEKTQEPEEKPKRQSRKPKVDDGGDE